MVGSHTHTAGGEMSELCWYPQLQNPITSPAASHSRNISLTMHDASIWWLVAWSHVAMGKVGYCAKGIHMMIGLHDRQ